MAIETGYELIVLGKKNVPMIEGTTMKVVELVTNHLTHGWSPEELHVQHPYLSMGQIHSALAYYWDHKKDLDEDIERRHEEVEAIRRSHPVSPVQKRLKRLANP